MQGLGDYGKERGSCNTARDSRDISRDYFGSGVCDHTGKEGKTMKTLRSCFSHVNAEVNWTLVTSCR